MIKTSYKTHIQMKNIYIKFRTNKHKLHQNLFMGLTQGDLSECDLSIQYTYLYM